MSKVNLHFERILVNLFYRSSHFVLDKVCYRVVRGSRPNGWTLANKLVFTKVRQALGLDRCKLCATAAAPIMKDTLDFFLSLNIPLMEIYGMSESTGKFVTSSDC